MRASNQKLIQPAEASLAEMMLQDVGKQPRAGGHAELAEDVVHIAFDGVYGDVQPVCDVPVALPRGEQPEDVALARRKAAHRRCNHGFPTLNTQELFRREYRKAWRQPQCLQQLSSRRPL